MATATLLPLPNFVAYDQLGNPLSGGFVYQYIPSTTTHKVTWQDAGETIENPQPVELNADGAATIYGSGDYELVTTTSTGTLVPAYCGLSQDISTLLAVETARALAAEAALASADLTLQANINAEAATRAAAVTVLQTEIVAEAATRAAADAVLQAEITAITAGAEKTGSSTTDGTGYVTITYGTPFAASTDNVQATVIAGVSPGGPGAWLVVFNVTRFGFEVQSGSPAFGGSWVSGPIGFYYRALGT